MIPRPPGAFPFSKTLTLSASLSAPLRTLLGDRRCCSRSSKQCSICSVGRLDMAKGDDAVRRKKNKINRKKVRNSESAVSARIASIIASKRRRNAGKRRSCEGMCFSLPTPDDPFNDLHGKKALSKLTKKTTEAEPPKTHNRDDKAPSSSRARVFRTSVHMLSNKERELEDGPSGKTEDCRMQGGKGELLVFDSGEATNSKFLVLCLKAIQDAWAEEGTFDPSAHAPLLASSWGAEFWGRCCAGLNVVDTSGASATREQIAWLVSVASDIVARKENQGHTVPIPFLLFIVPSQEKAIQVRSICKPLKALGVHAVSLHCGAPLDHQFHGLKSCEPEFVVSTPERLLQLISLRAIDISGVSLLVLDGIKDLADMGFMDAVASVRENISGYPQVVVFNEPCCDVSPSFLNDLVKEPAHVLCMDDSV